MTKRENAEQVVRERVLAAVQAGTESGQIIDRAILSVSAICDAVGASTSVGVYSIQTVAQETGWIVPERGVGVRLTASGYAAGNSSEITRATVLKELLAEVVSCRSSIQRAEAAIELMIKKAEDQVLE